MNYEAPKIEIIIFQDVQIETTNVTSSLDMPLDDWFNEGDS